VNQAGEWSVQDASPTKLLTLCSEIATQSSSSPLCPYCIAQRGDHRKTNSLPVFENQSKKLRQMLQLFKQPETPQSRQQLQECSLVQLGEQFKLPSYVPCAKQHQRRSLMGKIPIAPSPNCH